MYIKIGRKKKLWEEFIYLCLKRLCVRRPALDLALKSQSSQENCAEMGLVFLLWRRRFICPRRCSSKAFNELKQVALQPDLFWQRFSQSFTKPKVLILALALSL